MLKKVRHVDDNPPKCTFNCHFYELQAFHIEINRTSCLQKRCYYYKRIKLLYEFHSFLLLHSAKDIKHKISFLLQKPEHQTAEPKQTKEKTAVTAAAAAKRSEDACVLG